MEKRDVQILVADDEKLFLGMLDKVLSVSGYKPDLVSRGDEAIRKIKQKKYDVVITDIMMPGATGLDVLKSAKEEYPDSQVIIISAHGESENVIKAMRMGAVDFLQKPVEIPAIIPDIIERAAEKKRLLVENRELLDDLTKRTEELELALDTVQKQQEQLVHSERLKVLGTMSAGMAHEINNPLAFISTNIQTLEKYIEKLRGMLGSGDNGGLTDELNRVSEGVDSILKGVHKGVSRISQITMALRAFSRKEPGIQQQTSIMMCIDDAVSLLAPALKSVDLNLDLDDEDIVIMSNQQNMVHAIMNLVRNSCDAMEDSERRTLDIVTRVENGKKTLVVKDTGTGIPEDVKDKVFELFFTTKPVGKGSGMGLSIAIGVIEESGGEITLESEVGKGTKISVEWEA